MTFDSIDFAIFLPIVFFLYWFVANKSLTLQNVLIVLASYLFYGWWDWRFLFLVFFSTLIDYLIAIAISEQGHQIRKKVILGFSLLVNLGLLAFFKYYNFFLDSFITAFSFFGFEIKIDSLNIILPVGISFYTFQTLSYTIDVYKGKLEPTKDFIAFAAFVSFFPQLVAGPIERAMNLLPQFYTNRVFDYGNAVDGLRQMLWGLFKKIVIADNCAEFANIAFDNPGQHSGSTLFIGIVFFSFQIYCDFSGYSDIAIGTARLFGFNLMRNFAFPYFSRDIIEFWRRWHISLTMWFRNYIYIPLGGNLVSPWVQARNILIVFLLSGFWHGANWTFIIWGALNAFFFLGVKNLNKKPVQFEIVAVGKYYPSVTELTKMIFTFFLVSFTWIFFRSKNLAVAIVFISKLFSSSLFTIPHGSAFAGTTHHTLVLLLFLFGLIIVEWFGREQQHALNIIASKWPKVFQYVFYYSLIVSIVMLSGTKQDFIYFQF